MEQLETRLNRVEQNVNLLKWQSSIEYQKYNGVEYQYLDDATKIVCLARDFFELTKGEWSEDDLLSLKKAMATIGLNPRNKVSAEDFIYRVGADERLYNHLVKETSRFATESETLIFKLREVKSLNGRKNLVVREDNVGLYKIPHYEFILELLYDLKQIKYLNEQIPSAKEFFLNYELEKAVPILEEAAETGDTQARYILAVIYNEGADYNYYNPAYAKNLIEKNFSSGDVCSVFFGRRLGIFRENITDVAFSKLKQLADNDDFFAQYELSKYYSANGYKELALKYLERSADQNYFLAAYELGEKYYYNENYVRAKKYLEPLADKGHRKSMLLLGDIYWNHDKAKAVEQYKKAYELGIATNIGINRIGLYFSDKNDHVEALKWWRIGERYNYENCLPYLGWAYQYGKGAEINFLKAAEYFNRGINTGYSGNGYCEKQLGDIYFYGGYGVKQNYGKAIEWYKKAVAKGWESKDLTKNLAYARENIDDTAGYSPKQLGDFYYYGNRGFRIDYRKALRYYFKAVEYQYNDGYAEKQIGDIYFYGGYGVDKNHDKAIEWYKKAYELGKHSDYSLNNIGGYFCDRGDYEEALEWWRIGESYDYPKCIMNLGWAYRYGKGVDTDYLTAIEYFKRVIASGYSNDGYCEKQIGDIYFKGGYDFDKNYKEAIKWYEKACSKGRSDYDLIGNLARARWYVKH